jgi:hypothetical protein
MCGERKQSYGGNELVLLSLPVELSEKCKEGTNFAGRLFKSVMISDGQSDIWDPICYPRDGATCSSDGFKMAVSHGNAVCTCESQVHLKASEMVHV